MVNTEEIVDKTHSLLKDFFNLTVGEDKEITSEDFIKAITVLSGLFISEYLMLAKDTFEEDFKYEDFQKDFLFDIFHKINEGSSLKFDMLVKKDMSSMRAMSNSVQQAAPEIADEMEENYVNLRKSLENLS